MVKTNIEGDQDWQRDIEHNKEAITSISTKTDVEKVITKDNFNLNAGKRKNLGVLDEEVIYRYTFEELDHPETHEKLQQDISDSNVTKMVVSGKLYSEVLTKVIEIAKENELPFTIVQDPVYEGEMALGLLKEKS